MFVAASRILHRIRDDYPKEYTKLQLVGGQKRALILFKVVI